jgi:DNA-binding SARP family transcriptional activator
MRRLALAAARAIGSGTALAALVIGVPLVLTMGVGWPLPRVVNLEDIRKSLGGSTIADATILKALAVLGWAAWAQVVASVAVEVHAWARGLAAPEIPLARPFQPFVRYLVLALLVSVGTGRSTSPAVDLRLAVATTSVEVSADSCPPMPAEDLSSGHEVPAPEHIAYSVKPRDSLWKIAEEQLGDGFRWRELWELNRGVAQGDGRVLQDPDLLRPGWVLRLPSDAVHSPTPAAPLQPPEPSPQPEPAAVSPEPQSEPAHDDRAADGAVTVPTTVLPPPSPTPLAPKGRGEDGESSAPVLPAPVGVAGAGLLAAGLVATLNRLRRAQVRRRRPGYGIPTPAKEAAAAENTLRYIATLDRAQRVDLALRALAPCLRDSTDGAAPVIQAVLAGDDVEVLFAQPVDGDPGPFLVDVGGRAWTLPANADAARVQALAGEGQPVAPALVSIGRIDDRDLLVDLEAAAVTAVTGDPGDVEAARWHIAAGLATSPWADDLRVVIVGAGLPGFEALERVEVVDPAELLDHVRGDVLATRGELSAHGVRSTIEARTRGGSWTPTVVLLAVDLDEQHQELLAIAERGTGLAVLSASEPGSDRCIDVSSGVLTLTPPGIVAALPEIPADVRRAIDELFASAASSQGPEGEPIVDLTVETTSTAEGPSLAVIDGPAALEEGALLVRVLGHVDVEGGPAIDRRKSEELVVYLAMHSDGADEQSLKTALWPDGAPTSHTFNQVVSRARICLGTGPDGSHYLPRLEAGRYRLSEWVTTDVDRLSAALRSARVHPSTETMEHLAGALRLVRGQPFQGVKAGYEWAHSEGFATRFEILVADAAHLVADWHLEHGDTTAALWAAGQGLLSSPFDEALYRDRMRAHAAAGNHSAVESVMRELCKVVEAVEPYDSLHPETVELYEQLTRRRVG